jgi:hypothetical protein
MLTDNFHKELFDAALANLIDTSNKLRLNNFAYAAREFVRCYLSSIVDDKEVALCSWYTGDDGKVTRVDRMKYAIFRGLSEEYVADDVGIDSGAVIKKLRGCIDSLSKYTHVSRETFPTDSIPNTIAIELFNSLADFIETIHSTHSAVVDKLEENIVKEIESGLLMEYFESMDHIATHHGLEDVYVGSIGIESFDSVSLKFKVEGQLEFSLQWGSNSDVRNDIGAEGEITVPFSAIVEADINDVEELTLVSYSLDEDSIPC